MAAIREIVRNGRGTAHAWRIVRYTDPGRDRAELCGCDVAELWHYGTRMLRWNVVHPSDPDVLDFDTGWGSVSDQNGMNTAFRELGLPYRFDRDSRGGGPRITELRRHPCGCVTDPSVTACGCARELAGVGR